MNFVHIWFIFYEMNVSVKANVQSKKSLKFMVGHCMLSQHPRIFSILQNPKKFCSFFRRINIVFKGVYKSTLQVTRVQENVPSSCQLWHGINIELERCLDFILRWTHTRGLLFMPTIFNSILILPLKCLNFESLVTSCLGLHSGVGVKQSIHRVAPWSIPCSWYGCLV